MSRPVVLSNGELHVGLDEYGFVHDMYFPYVGYENHAGGASISHHIGVWIDGVMSWLNNTTWCITHSYPHEGLISHTIATQAELGVRIEFDDAVDTDINLFMRSIHVINLRDTDREIRLFMHQAFTIGDARNNTDTGQFLPDQSVLLHYRGRRAFVVSLRAADRCFDQHSIGIFGLEGREGTFRDAEDGELSGSSVDHGQVDSTVRMILPIQAHSSVRAEYWVAAGTSTREALRVHKFALRDGATKRLLQTAAWWERWLRPARRAASHLSPDYRTLFVRNIMLIKAHIDRRGAVIASTDTALLNYARDSYAYCWPRDGAYALWPLIRIGYTDEPHAFFEFCRRALNAGGYLMHKYRADGALGSSWHPYLHAEGIIAPPIQEDETALVVFMFVQYYEMNASPALLQEFYQSMIVPMANFMAEYIDKKTGLPKASYDLWEEKFLTTTYSTSLVYAALVAAASLAEVAGDNQSAVKWRTAADDIQSAAKQYLYSNAKQCFYKGLLAAPSGDISYDDTIDSSSVFGVFMYGLFDTNSDEMANSMSTLLRTFDQSVHLGLPRYIDDNYHRTDASAPSNTWLITSLWLAQYCNVIGRRDTAKQLVDWVVGVGLPTGMLSEQIDPLTGDAVSVMPLVWSQAELANTLLDLASEIGE